MKIKNNNNLKKKKFIKLFKAPKLKLSFIKSKIFNLNKKSSEYLSGFDGIKYFEKKLNFKMKFNNNFQKKKKYINKSYTSDGNFITKKDNIVNYFYKRKKLKKAIFLKKPKHKQIIYPFFLNINLINDYLQ